tara:strand:- start:663 stop:1259 length:597 start_codon:yes stop_codon:yes gene_type:complete
MKIIFITGASGSGKTTLSNKLSELLYNSIVLRTDNYYKIGYRSLLLSLFIKSYFDKIISLDKVLFFNDLNRIIEKKEVSHFYRYDFITKKRLKFNNKISDLKYLLIEGIFSQEILKESNLLNCLLIKLNLKKEICLKRIMARDQKERGKNKEKSINDFHNGYFVYKQKEKEINLNKRYEEIVFTKEPDIQKILDKLKS